MPWKRGRTDTNRPLGPLGMPCVQSFSATCGASRLATAQALGGLKIKAPLPETSHLLLEALSQAPTSGGRNSPSRLRYSRACRTASDFTVMLPLASTSSAPCARKNAPEPLDAVGGDAERQAESEAGLVALLGGDEEGVPGPAVGRLGRLLAGRIHGKDVDAGVLLHEVEAAACRQEQGAADAGHRQPFALRLGQVLVLRADRTVAGEHLGHDVVDRLEGGCVLRPAPRPRSP